jgi:hypothetical protein
MAVQVWKRVDIMVEWMPDEEIKLLMRLGWRLTGAVLV